ncbi:MAG TPA: sugar phosphate isomerase/epimerase family protein [Chthoniobacteraceae bacterium]|nr:sugar phosphate isomerase/epimerase family protein [Chthoniobacteraceae bacterium]
MNPLSRRSFLKTLGSAALASPLTGRSADPAPWPVLGFTKPFQKASFDRTAEIVSEIGWSGIELPLRAKGQIEPERVEEELPRLVDTLRKRNLTVGVITTDIVGADSPHTEKVLRTAKALGITRYRPGYYRYDSKVSPQKQLAELKPRVRELAALNRQLGVRAGFQNHSGAGMIGCAVWDLFELIRDLDPADIGVSFDIGHATLEGGSSWPVEARLIEPWLVAVYVKDFSWQRGAKGFEAKWGPLGEGMIRPEFFDWLRKSSFRGPISLHVEYISGDTPENLTQMKRDQARLREWIG